MYFGYRNFTEKIKKKLGLTISNSGWFYSFSVLYGVKIYFLTILSDLKTLLYQLERETTTKLNSQGFLFLVLTLWGSSSLSAPGPAKVNFTQCLWSASELCDSVPYIVSSLITEFEI